MKAVNKVILIGNLTRDPEMVQINQNTDVAKFSLAVNESYKKADGETVENTVFLECEAWSGLAKVAGNYLKKGSKVYIEGNLREDKWTDAESGKSRSKIKIRVVDLVMLDKREGGDYGSSGGSYSKSESNESPIKPVDDDELPF